MSMQYYTTASGRSTFGFDVGTLLGRYQIHVRTGPSYPPDLVPAQQAPPGCERDGNLWRLTWLTMPAHPVQRMEHALRVAASWAEHTESFQSSLKWQVPYRTNDGRFIFRFSIERVDSSLRVYIQEQPAYGRRSAAFRLTHGLNDANGLNYIDWSVPIIAWPEAESIAAHWAELTGRYILNGSLFPVEQSARQTDDLSSSDEADDEDDLTQSIGDGRYVFEHAYEGGGWRAYIVSQPSYGGRDDGSHATHRLSGKGGRRYVCWSTTVATKEESRGVAKMWAGATDRYITTGATF